MKTATESVAGSRESDIVYNIRQKSKYLEIKGAVSKESSLKNNEPQDSVRGKTTLKLSRPRLLGYFLGSLDKKERPVIDLPPVYGEQQERGWGDRIGVVVTFRLRRATGGEGGSIGWMVLVENPLRCIRG